MKKGFLIWCLFSCVFGFSQSIVGTWKSVDEETNKEESVIEIYKENEKFYGKIIRITDPARQSAVCENCKGTNKDKPILGMVILQGLKKEGSSWSGGKILDPKNGKKYKCTVSLEGENTLKLRGYIGFSVFGRTAYWYRTTD